MREKAPGTDDDDFPPDGQEHGGNCLASLILTMALIGAALWQIGAFG